MPSYRLKRASGGNGRMGYVTPEQIAQAKEWDLLTYIQRYDPHQLVHVGGSTY